MKNFWSIDIDRKRIFGLDLLRAFAIFCVVQGHAERILFDTPLDRFTDMPVPHGVDIFFVMTGFLIAKSFISHLEKHDNQISRSKTLTFYGRTALRILPNYLFILLVNYLWCSIKSLRATPRHSRFGVLPLLPKTYLRRFGGSIGSPIPCPCNGGSMSSSLSS